MILLVTVVAVAVVVLGICFAAIYALNKDVDQHGR